MPENYHAVLHLSSTTGLPRDEAVMDFWLTRAASAASGDFDNANGRISAFFNTVASGATNKIGAYISQSMDRTANKCITDFYHLSSLLPVVNGPIVATRTFTLPAPYTGSVPLPNQLAACVSWHGDLTGIPEHGTGGTRPRARRRGRIYVGPLNTQTLQAATGGTAAQTISSVTINDLAKAAGVLWTNLAVDGWALSVFSRVDGAMHAVVGGWCDDQWDVQRRRQVETTGRITF